MLHFTPLLDWLWPPLCVHCRREGGWLCATARDAIDNQRPLRDPLSIPGVDTVITRGSYDCPPLALIIQCLKYRYWTGLSPVLSELLRPLGDHLPRHGGSVIVPVPLHSRRVRERGFNQAQVLSRALRGSTGLPLADLLHRTRYTTPQAQLSAAQRQSNLIGAFNNRRVAKWPNSVILVDDVITTGSTIAECASVLRQHDVQHITAVALAKG